MSLWSLALINGVAIGGLYGLFALSVVVLHRTTGIVNFAQGNVSMFLAFLVYEVMTRAGLNPWVALLLLLPVGALFGGAIHIGIVMPFRSDDHLNVLFRTLALMLLLFAVAQRIWGAHEPYYLKSLFGLGGVDIGSYRVSALQIGALCTAIVLAGLFGVFLFRTRLGLMMRASSSDRAAARVLGVNVGLADLTAWAVTGMFCLVLGMLFATFYSLNVELMGGVLIKGFTAAILGGLNSLRGALVAGLLIGIIDSELGVYASPEWQSIAAFLIMGSVLLIRPEGIFQRVIAERA
jgi:branched-chain amino acid transport system permease protein